MKLRLFSLLPFLLASGGAPAGTLELPPPGQGQAEKLGVAPSGSGAEKLDWPPSYVPTRQVSGTIRIWGHGAYGQAQDFIEGLTRAWEEGFRRHQPLVSFENR